MNPLKLFRRRTPETRAASQTGFTAQVLEARGDFIAGRQGLSELTATVQGAVSLWEGGLSQAAVTGTDLLDARTLAIMARSLALRGEAVFLIRDRLVPCSDWDLRTADGRPTAYQCTVAEAGGGRTVTALAGEVLHVTIGTDAVTPWAGSPPLRRAQITAGLLHALEAALSEVYTQAPLGSLVAPYPETPEVSRDELARSFRGKRGRVLLRESTAVAAGGGPAPAQDWRPESLSPDLQRAMTGESLDGARNAILHAFGVLPALLDPKATGNGVREGQRHLATWVLTPIAELVALEASEKLDAGVTLDCMRPLQAYDQGARARGFTAVVEAMAKAREAGLSDEAVAAAAKFAGVPSEE
jgi:hypothetical protein